ncbi:hypothetical protein N658DRAFT_516500 [Parathielavia hyrcaniae]|uniref:RING-type domain-containing protein n=1 Tax=Parathielavia hyrcaniae TaxID=113614 RepID=A0AAN6PZI9_9PEZI|nr:hypothetical protein N658DRAFT_516500 [Parathielavia hyrcaniae]
MFDHVHVNPSWNGDGTDSSTSIRNISALSSEMGYSARFTGDTTVLSTRFADTASGVISGLMFVPDLPSDDPCSYETAHYVPLSTVHKADLPPMNYYLIALAPWVNDRCAEAYMTAASTAPVRAFLFYLPGTDSAPPPPADAPEWYIQDHPDWMTQAGYPVYAVSGMAGEVMMQHLSLYSGNMSQVPYGRNLTERFRSDPSDYLRIWTELDISTHKTAFDTWVYALIIVGLLLTVITATSLLMHLVQAHARASLRRRVVAGEVNLEAMGIQRLTVPAEQIQIFPLFTYHYEPEASSPPLSPPPRSAKTARTRTRPHSRTERSAVVAANTSTTISTPPAFTTTTTTTTAYQYQPSCKLCLAPPFENRATVIRELPCGHIFHPACIDDFLRHVSSLCPVCKAGMLPAGCCPTRITNAMVRRERAIRRLRRVVCEEGEGEGEGEETGSGKHRGGWWWMAEGVQLKRRSSLRGGVNIQGGGAPVALARERMRELAGFQLDYGEVGMTIWQRIGSRIFPGFY